MPRSKAKEHALREITLIAQGSNPQQSPVIEEFQKCPEWQLAAVILARAVRQEQTICRQIAGAKLFSVPNQKLAPHMRAFSKGRVGKSHGEETLYQVTAKQRVKV